MKHETLRGCKKIDCNWCCYNDCTTLYCEVEPTPQEDNSAPNITQITIRTSPSPPEEIAVRVPYVEDAEVAPTPIDQPNSLIGYLFIGGIILGLILLTLLLLNVEKKWEEQSEKGKF